MNQTSLNQNRGPSNRLKHLGAGSLADQSGPSSHPCTVQGGGRWGCQQHGSVRYVDSSRGISSDSAM